MRQKKQHRQRQVYRTAGCVWGRVDKAFPSDFIKGGGSGEMTMDDGRNHGIWVRQMGDIEHQNTTLWFCLNSLILAFIFLLPKTIVKASGGQQNDLAQRKCLHNFSQTRKIFSEMYLSI